MQLAIVLMAKQEILGWSKRKTIPKSPALHFAAMVKIRQYVKGNAFT